MPRSSLIADLRFAEAPVLVEQVRLLLGSVVSSTVPVVVLSLLMFLTLANGDNFTTLLIWFMVVVVSKLASLWVAWRCLARPIAYSAARPLAWSMVGFYAFNGLAWGSLPWLAMDNATPVGKVIILAVMAGVIGSAMAQTSAVLAVFVAFAVTTLGLVTVKLLQLNDPAYTALAGATVLYFSSLLSLARNNANAALGAIRLRFENTDLMEQLQMESAVADEARQEAETANQAKSRFLAAASHDLRQPIHTQGLLLAVLEGTALNPQQQELVESLRNASQASSEMLNTLLDFSRIEAGVITPRLQPFPLQPLLYKLEKELAPLADAKGLVYRTRETRLALYSDPSLLELIMRNLISNAIRYTDAGGVLVGARRRGEECLIEVWDTGIGIEPGQQRAVFGEFHQLGNPERDSRKGLGLGLAISQGLSRTLGHKLRLSSVPGRGSLFRLELPLSTTAAVAPQSAAASSGRVPLAARVLVIEDDEGARQSMGRLLKSWGCEVRTAEGLEEALGLLKGWRPDVLASDYRLRGQTTGVEAIDALRKRLDCVLPALLITGDTDPQRLREAEDSGVPLLHKPVASGELYEVMQRLT
ncbi:MAG: ATP-binding response regulator [Pseudomonadota bacterium]